MWDQVRQHPERTPVLGFYDQANPEVADWETKWAVEHGINFFVYCWYRAGKADAVETKYSSAIEALLKSRFANQFKFTIMWENQQRGGAWGSSGVSGEKDLLEPLAAFWITNYFRQPSYLKIDNKPLLFVYDAHRLAADLGGVTNVPRAFEQMRAACRRAGFAGLYLLAEYRGLDPQELQFRKDMGFDYTFAYVWPISKPEEAVPMQLDFIRKTRDLKILPEVVTVSQGWTGWRNEGPLYRIPPGDFEGLLRQAKDILATMPQTELGSKVLLLDNWNEWSEGHYLAPHRQYGFGYLDAVRKVFSDAPEKHMDLDPRGYRAWALRYRRQGPPALADRAVSYRHPASADGKGQPPLLSGRAGSAAGHLLHLRGHIGNDLLLGVGEAGSVGKLFQGRQRGGVVNTPNATDRLCRQRLEGPGWRC